MISTGNAEAGAGRVYTVPLGVPFLATVAAAILDGRFSSTGRPPSSPLDLVDYTIILPTRRATRGLQQAFLHASGGRAMLLPAIRAISEGEEDLGLVQTVADLGAGAAHNLEPAIGGLERRLALTRLVLSWSKSRVQASAETTEQADETLVTPAQAALLAADLARLMDAVETECVDLAGLATLVPDKFSEHWQQTIEFLAILTQHWPQYLALNQKASPASRRNALIQAEAKRLREHPPKGPVIIVGVTGSVPATTELMQAVVSLEQGALVLPWLDLALDETSWELVATSQPEHPQHGLARLLKALAVRREHVQLLGAATPAGVTRSRLVSETMRPSGTTEAWAGFVATADPIAYAASLKGLSQIVAQSAQDEAEAVALIMREAVETPDRTAALVSPDRLLARRVAARLETWGIRVDDSAGRPLAKTVPGTFLDLVINAAVNQFQPAELMALLKHPLVRLGLPAGNVRRAARTLELLLFRRPYLGRGLIGLDAGLEKAIREFEEGKRQPGPIRRIPAAGLVAARDLVQRLLVALGPIETVMSNERPMLLATLVAAHVAAAEALATVVRPDAEPGEAPAANALWEGEAGEAAALILGGLQDAAMPPLEIEPRHYPDFLRSLVSTENVRPRVPVHPRLSIWGPYEARLQSTDVIILGSLNDGVWPEAADPGPWLNRPMRQQLGMPSPEEGIGRSAHDFCSLLGAERVYLSRAAKIDGVPTVPSRWLMRLSALLGGMKLAHAIETTEPWLAWAGARDRVTSRRHVSAPRPKPPVALRPRRMSVTEVGQWIANPYSVFARRILALDPLPEIGAALGPSERGEVLHEVVGRFTARYPVALPVNVAACLVELLGEVLEEHTGDPRVAAFWQPRFEQFIRWFAETEAERRVGIERVLAEVGGKLTFDAPAGPFMLSGRADRIDVGGDGIVITDYKTGAIPTVGRVDSGEAPQLSLEAAIAVAGGFPGIERADVKTLRYIRASGGEPPGVAKDIMPKGRDPMALAAEALDGLKSLVARYDNPAEPYAAVRRPRFASTYEFDDFAHLARVPEWSIQNGDDGDNGDGGEGAV